MIPAPETAGRPLIEATSDVDPTAEVGAETRVWHLAQVRENASIGSGCILGRGSYIGPGVILGRNCKVQNYALIYEPAVLEDGVFVGPAVVFTNDMFPRAVNPDLSIKAAEDWHPVGVHVGTGASIGARAVCIGPVSIGRWALIAAGAVVTKDVPDYAIVAGVPARRIGWVGRSGIPLRRAEDGRLTCPATGEHFHERDGVLLAERESG
ncbi:UDP-2-acetamido-3-amino-2,3-dideoxy-glucuronate N-acetyltransferase [Cryobacterium sp. MP_3.1]|nr:UDP-2-acetamido-3-amino-2,3-dideoxy-glucuronate N-acetyltransferase [Cryobacterium sp. MP_3.1]